MNKNRISTVWKAFNTLLIYYPEESINLERIMLHYDQLVKEKTPHSAGDLVFWEAQSILNDRQVKTERTKENEASLLHYASLVFGNTPSDSSLKS